MPLRARAGFAGARVLRPTGPPLPSRQGGPEEAPRTTLPLRIVALRTLGDGRGLNPSPDEREPAAQEYYAEGPPKTTRVVSAKRWTLSSRRRPIDSTRNYNGEAAVAIRVGINGFGRIGRNFFRAHLAARRRLRDRRGERPRRRRDDGAPAQARLRARHARPARSRPATARSPSAAQEIKLLTERDPAALPWGDLGVDVVIESTGFFTDRDGRAEAPRRPARRR